MTIQYGYIREGVLHTTVTDPIDWICSPASEDPESPVKKAKCESFPDDAKAEDFDISEDGYSATIDVGRYTQRKYLESLQPTEEQEVERWRSSQATVPTPTRATPPSRSSRGRSGPR